MIKREKKNIIILLFFYIFFLSYQIFIIYINFSLIYMILSNCLLHSKHYLMQKSDIRKEKSKTNHQSKSTPIKYEMRVTWIEVWKRHTNLLQTFFKLTQSPNKHQREILTKNQSSRSMSATQKKFKNKKEEPYRGTHSFFPSAAQLRKGNHNS